MPKLKSKRGAKKRFKVTAKGKIKASKSFRRHILTSKRHKRKRHLRKGMILSPSETKRLMISLLGG